MPSNLSKKELTDIIQWDVKNWKNALSFWEAHFDIRPGMKVLALGEREGGLSLYFAQKGCQVICSDYNEPSELAAKMHRDYKVNEKITYAKIDMREINYPDATFDIVVFKSVIGALGNQEEQYKAISEIQRVLKKGGAFLFAENASASRLHRMMRKKFVKWEGKWYYVSDKEFDEWKTKFSKHDSKKIGFIAVFGRTERQRNFLGAIDSVLSRIIPKSWRYIFIGAYIK